MSVLVWAMPGSFDAFGASYAYGSYRGEGPQPPAKRLGLIAGSGACDRAGI